MGIYWPLPVEVALTSEGAPAALDGVAVVSVREEWLVEDRWWTPRPLRRRYFELVLADGRDVVVFREPAERAGEGEAGGGRPREVGGRPHASEAAPGRWFRQRA